MVRSKLKKAAKKAPKKTVKVAAKKPAAKKKPQAIKVRARVLPKGKPKVPAKPPAAKIVKPLTVADRIKANRLRAEQEALRTVPPHLIVQAGAGCGKTTTLVEGIREVLGGKPLITPSKEQSAIWDALTLTKNPRSVGFAAFNTSIKDELVERVPPGCEATTMHSLGVRAVNATYGRKELNRHRTGDTVCDIMRTPFKLLNKSRPGLLQTMEKIVSLCKLTLCDGTNSDGEEDWDTALTELAYRYDVETENWADVVELVPQVLERHLDPNDDNCISFDDMVWLPVVQNLKVYQHELLLVDEAQDLSRCHQELVRKAGRRLVLCGDPNQAIYGFAGADSESMKRMEELLASTPSGCRTLPLMETRRCGKSIVEVANRLVPELRAHPSNGEGSVTSMAYPAQPGGAETLPDAQTYLAKVASGDMVLCRTNAPLARQCFKMIRMGKRATIQGRNVASGLIDLVKKMDAPTPSQPESIVPFVAKLHEWQTREVAKEQAKTHPNEDRIQSFVDRAECLMCFADNSGSVDEVLRRIDEMFTDRRDEPGIRLSSIHKAKGLEARRVFYLKPKVLFRPGKPKSPSELQSERNCEYVAVTRAKEELVFVY